MGAFSFLYGNLIWPWQYPSKHTATTTATTTTTLLVSVCTVSQKNSAAYVCVCVPEQNAFSSHCCSVQSFSLLHPFKTSVLFYLSTQALIVMLIFCAIWEFAYQEFMHSHHHHHHHGCNFCSRNRNFSVWRQFPAPFSQYPDRWWFRCGSCCDGDDDDGGGNGAGFDSAGKDDSSSSSVMVVDGLSFPNEPT